MCSLGMGSEGEGRPQQVSLTVLGMRLGVGCWISGAVGEVWVSLQPLVPLGGVMSGAEKHTEGGQLEREDLWDPQEMGMQGKLAGVFCCKDQDKSGEGSG